MAVVAVKSYIEYLIVTRVLRREPTIDFQTAFAAGLEGVKELQPLVELYLGLPETTDSKLCTHSNN